MAQDIDARLALLAANGFADGLNLTRLSPAGARRSEPPAGHRRIRADHRREGRMIERDADAPSRQRIASRPGLVGALAGLVGIGCCVYPVVLVLLGISTATAAVDLGNRLFAEWGWAFKLAGLSLIVSAVVVQRRRARACTDAWPRVLRGR
jgi:hypothetical protein